MGQGAFWRFAPTPPRRARGSAAAGRTFGWPSAARFELGTLDGMIGCVAADMGVTLLPRAVVGRNETVSVHTLSPAQSKVDTLFITRRSAHQYSALQSFAGCLDGNGEVIAA